MCALGMCASKHVSMPLEDWARVVEIAHKYKQKSISKAIIIAIRKQHKEME